MYCKICGYHSDNTENMPEKCPACGAYCPKRGAARLPGDMIGSFRVLRLIGRAGSGEIYLCDNPVLMERVAVKVLSDCKASHDPVFIERLLREAKIAAALRHPDVVAILDAGVDEVSGEPYIVMEYVDGESLETILQEGPLTENSVISIALKVARVLAAAEKLGVVHRDIKPGNILFTSSGSIKLVDLGIAKSGAITDDTISGKNILLGTPNYSAPEQLRDAGNVDIRADIYSLGATMYHMLTGVRPFQTDSVFNTVAQVLENNAVPISSYRKNISSRTLKLIDQMMAKAPAARVRNTAALIHMLNKCNARPRFSVDGILPGGYRFYRRNLRSYRGGRTRSRIITPVKMIRDLFLCCAVLACLLFSWFNFGKSYSDRLRVQHLEKLEKERKEAVQKLFDGGSYDDISKFIGSAETSYRSKRELFSLLLKSAEHHSLLLELINADLFSGNEHEDYLSVACSTPNCGGDVVETLIRSGAAIDRRDGKGRTPLMKAMLAGNTGAVDILLNYGADAHYIDEDRRNIYFYLPAKFPPELLDRLKQLEINVNSFDRRGRTPLMVFVDRFDSPEMVAMMIKNKFNINRRAHNGDTAFATAIRRRHIRSAEILFKAGAKFDQKLTNQVSREYRLRYWMDLKSVKGR